LVLPEASAQEAALVPGAEIFRAHHLLDVVRQFLPGDAPVEDTDGWARVKPVALPAQTAYPDLADVKGQAAARRALEIAAAGGHSVLMMGAPGSGKSMLAQRFAGLLPAMTTEEALESAAVASLGGRFTMDKWALRPTCAPHHTASAVALVGGGSPPRPGEISLAHRGVLFWTSCRSSRAPRWKPARAAGVRRHHHFARRPARRIPGALSAGRRHEPLPLRLPRLQFARLPLLA
jgi:magnesium chelatase family protein